MPAPFPFVAPDPKPPKLHWHDDAFLRFAVTRVAARIGDGIGFPEWVITETLKALEQLIEECRVRGVTLTPDPARGVVAIDWGTHPEHEVLKDKVRRLKPMMLLKEREAP